MTGFDRPNAGDRLDSLSPMETGPSLSDRVYDTLLKHIVGQILKPGTRLSVPRLAHRLGVSRTPVKEALERLTQEGFVTTLPNRGAFVTIYRREDLDELYQLREVLEGLAARLAAPKMDSGLLEELRGLLSRGEAAVGKGDIFAHATIDLEFHRLIREQAGNRRLARTLDNLQDQIRVVLRTSATIPGSMQKALAEHRTILAALEVRDPDGAERATRSHVRRIREAVLMHMEATAASS